MSENQVVHEAFTELAPRYESVVDGELKTFWGWSYQGFVDQLIERTAIQNNQKVLDIATGTSVIPRKILQQKIPDLHITGLDITEAMLQQGKKTFPEGVFRTALSLTCGDAMKLPFADNSYDVIVSGLASHHMNIPIMLSEMRRVLKPQGTLSIIDVGTSSFWELPIIRGFTRIFAFAYFLWKENSTRAWAEAAAVTNLRTPEGWLADLQAAGFDSISISKLSSKYRWAPEPLSILSTFQGEEK